MSEFLEDWRVRVRESIGEFARVRMEQPELSFSHGILPAAVLWPILASIKNFESPALEAVRELAGDQAPIILRAAQFLEADRLSVARSLAEAATRDPELGSALEILNTNLAPLDMVIDAIARAEVSRRGAGDVNNFSGQIKGWLVNIGGRVNIDKLSFTLPPVSRAEQQDRNHQLILLKRVREVWVKGVLERSLYRRVKLEVGLEALPEAVEQPWDRILETPSGRRQVIPPTENLLDIFGASGYALLILGEPGAGKTTLLLELARVCLEEAEDSPSFPVPTIFNLASWTPQKSFEDWLVEELLSIYQIPRRYGHAWIGNDALMLFLDGLDEVRPEQRQACVEAINDFREKHGVSYIAVCSRSFEYQALERPLTLGTAIVLQPLQEAQIEAYLQEIGEPAEALRTALVADPLLRELTRTPLLLNVMVLAYSGEAKDSISIDPSESIESRRRRLFDAYVDKMLRRSRAGPRYSPEQTMKTLSWLAFQMQRHSTSVFLIEQIQPSWLSPQWPRRLYRHLRSEEQLFKPAMVATIVLTGILATLLSWEPIGEVFFAILVGVGVGFVTWLIWTIAKAIQASFLNGQIEAVETLRWSWEKATAPGGVPSNLDRLFSQENTKRLGWASVLSGIITIIRLCMLINESPEILVIFPLVILALAVLIGFIIFMVRGLEYGQIRTRLVPNQGIWRSAANGLLVMVVSGILAGALATLLTRLTLLLITGDAGWNVAIWVGAPIGLLVGILLGMRAGGFAFMLHFILRWLLQRQRIAPANLAGLLDYASGQILLQKVGGGYMFIHRLLAEHFAASEILPKEPIMQNPADWIHVAGMAVMDLWRTDIKDAQERNLIIAKALTYMPLINLGSVDNEVVKTLLSFAYVTHRHNSPALVYLGHLQTRNETIRAQILAATSDRQPSIRAMAVLALGGNLSGPWKDLIGQGDLERVRMFLKAGADVNAKDEHGQTALMNAAHAGQFELVRLLVEHGAALNVTAKYNLSALMLAIIARHTDVAQVLIEAGADVNIRSTRSFMEKTALSLAEEGGLNQIVALLEQRKAVR